MICRVIWSPLARQGARGETGPEGFLGQSLVEIPLEEYGL